MKGKSTKFTLGNKETPRIAILVVDLPISLTLPDSARCTWFSDCDRLNLNVKRSINKLCPFKNKGGEKKALTCQNRKNNNSIQKYVLMQHFMTNK